MLKPRIIAAGILLSSLLLSAGCASQGDRPGTATPPPGGKPAPLAENASLYTTTRAVYVAGELEGYLLVFDEPPVPTEKPDAVEPGTTFIKNLDFDNVGFITPRGALYRFGPDNDPERIHQGSLEENLALFYRTAKKDIVLKDL